MIFLGTPQLRGGVHIIFFYKVSFAKHSSAHVYITKNWVAMRAQDLCCDKGCDECPVLLCACMETLLCRSKLCKILQGSVQVEAKAVLTKLLYIQLQVLNSDCFRVSGNHVI